jgi:uncharacterized coiled-coil protein SlyX
MGNLSNLYISQSFQSLIHLGTNNTASAALIELQDGYGNNIGVAVNTAGDLFLSGSLTASLQQGYLYVGGANGKTTAFATSSLVATVDTGSLVTTASFNSYTQSTNIRLNNLESTSASVNISISNLNSTTSSFATSIANLNSNSASVNTSITNLNASSASQQVSIDALNTFTASQSTASIVTSINNLNTFSASALVSINNINSTTASLNTSVSNLNTFTQSQEGVNSLLAGEIDSLQAKTGSYATTGSNNFIGDQNITGNITALSASFTYLQTIYESSSIIYSSGSNQFGDELTDVQTLSGSVRVQGSLTVNGTPVLTSSVDISGLVTTASFNAYTQSNNQRVSSLESNSASVNVSITNINSTTASLNTSVAALNTFTASQSTASLVTSINNLNTFSASALVSINALNAATSSYVTSAITASSLITASVSLNTITFTKGDGTTFPITVNTGSGGGGSTDTGSLMVTGSIAGNILTFTKGDASTFNLTIPSATGSVFDTGSFATTGSNVFIGNQTISGSVAVKDILSFPNGLAFQGNATDVSQISATTTIQLITEPPAGPGGTNDIKFINRVTGSSVSFINEREGAGNSVYFEAGDVDFNVGARSGSIGRVRFRSTVTQIDASDTPITASALRTTTGGIYSAGALTASLQQGYAWVGNSSGVSTLVATSSFGGAIPAGLYATLGANTFTGSQTITGTSLNLYAAGGGSNSINVSGSQNNLTFTAPNTFFQAGGLFNFNNNYTNGGSGSLEFSAVSSSIGFYPTNGLILGRATVEGGPIGVGFVRMASFSGSLILTPSSFTNTVASNLHLTGSSNTNNVNLIFKNNSNAQSTIISGSNNIFVNAAAPTAGFTRYVGTTGNLALNQSNVAQISSSMAFSPTLNNNIFNGNAQTLFMRGPVSSSAWTIAANLMQNNVNFGSSATAHAQGIGSGLTMTSNIINAGLTVVANTSPLTQPLSITNNIITNAALNPISSSIVYTANVGGITVNNLASGSGIYLTNLSNAIYLQANNFGGTGNSITATGSHDPGDTQANSYLRQVQWNSIIGNGIGVNLPYNLTGSNSLVATSIQGFALGVTGSQVSPNSGYPQNGGSAFFGRFNALDGNRAQSAATIFAVGTGVAQAGAAPIRKTGFLIDSGSNTFIEGTLNVSGSTTITGSLILSSSNTVELFVIGDSQFTGSLSITGSASVNGSQLVKSNQTGSYLVSLYPTANPLQFEYDLGNGGGNQYTLVAPTSLTGSVIITSGSQLTLPTGSNQQAGTAVLDGANPSEVIVSNSLVTADSIIMLTKQTLTNSHMVAVSSKGSGTFTITSNGNGDSDTVGWFIINNS